jgi:hypothetical protein
VDQRAFSISAFEQAESRWVYYGKSIIMECEENLGMGTMDRSEIQVLTGVNRLHGLSLGIREGSADSNTNGIFKKVL